MNVLPVLMVTPLSVAAAAVHGPAAAGGRERAAGDRAGPGTGQLHDRAGARRLDGAAGIGDSCAQVERAAVGGLEQVAVLVTVLVGATCKPPVWLALIVPLLVRVKAKPALLMPSWPEPWIVLLVSLISVSGRLLP